MTYPSDITNCRVTFRVRVLYPVTTVVTREINTNEHEIFTKGGKLSLPVGNTTREMLRSSISIGFRFFTALLGMTAI